MRTQARLFTGVQTIVWRKDRALIQEMHDLRDEMKRTPSGRQVCEGLPTKLGGVESAACVGQLESVVKDHFDNEPFSASQLESLDRRLCLPLLHITAEVVLGKFAEKMRTLFPEAVDDVELLDAESSNRFALLLGPLKEEPRIQVKMDEYREENTDDAQWMFSPKASPRARNVRPLG